MICKETFFLGKPITPQSCIPTSL
uniref:Uncharacterized protein n=1 Tax=Arundo donax TaxID=35708 RepID=A0A0A8YSG9_ARUDO